MPTINDLRQQAATIKNATQVGENTATRVGTTFETIADLLEGASVGQGVPSVDLSQLNALRTPADQTTANPTIYNVTTLHNLSSTTIKVGTLFIFSDGGRAVVTQILLSNYQVDGGGNISSPNTSQITMYYRMFNIVQETWSAWTLYAGGGGGGTIDPYPVSGSDNAVASNGVFEGLQKAAPEVDINDIDDLDDYVNMQTGEASMYTIKAYHNLSSTWLRVGVLMVFANQAQNTLTQICISNCMVDGGGNLIPNYATNVMNVFYRFKQFSGNPPEGMTIGVWTTWAKFGDSGYQPDNEDIDLNASDQLQFANKSYDASAFSGLGRVYLRKNIVTSGGVDKNVLTQAMVNTANTIYHIQYNYDLNGQTITLPANSVLQMDGGCLDNGKIVFQNTSIVSDKECFGEDLEIDGKVLQEANPDWFVGSDADKIEKVIDVFGVAKLAARDYLIDRTINVQHSFRLNGCGIPSNFGNYATPSKSNDYSSSRLIPIADIGNILACVEPSGRFVSFVLSGVSFVRPTSEAWYNDYKSLTTNVNGFAISTPNGPSRPAVIENCNFSMLNYGIYIYDYDESLNRGTCINNLYITGCNISNNIQGIHAEGKHALNGVTISHNVIEANSGYGIYCCNPNDSAFSTKAVCAGYIEISDNLMEGQANPIYCTLTRGTLTIKGNYYETSNPLGSTITVIGGLELSGYYQTVILEDNTASTNLGGGVVYNLSGVGLVDNDKGNAEGALLLNNVAIKSFYLRKQVKGSRFAYTPNQNNTTSQPLLKIPITPTVIYEGELAYTLQKSTGTYVDLTLSSSMPAGSYRIIAMGNNLAIGLKKTVSGTTSTIFDVTDMNPSPLGDVRVLELAFTLNDAIPSGGILRVQPRRTSTFFSGFAIYEDDGNPHKQYNFDPLDYVKSTKGIVENPIIGFEWYDEALSKTLRIADIVNGAAVWKDLDGFTPALSRGTAAQRPALTEMMDSGFEYYDTTINKDISLAFIEGSSTQLAQIKNQQIYKSNPIAEGTYIRIRAMQIKISDGLTGVQFIFCKTNASTDEGIEIPFITLDTSGYGNAYTDYFFAPDPSVYPYIFVKTIYTGYTFFYSYPYTAKWLEVDGATAGVKRNGATSERPASGDIYVGFKYFDETLGKPIWWNGSAWVGATGTAV